MRVNLSELKDRVLIDVTRQDNEILFTCENGDRYKLFHEQDCLELVEIEDISGDLNDLIGSRLLLAEEVSNKEYIKSQNKTKQKLKNNTSFKWTFYKFATIKGFVDIRWYGHCSGDYSISVDFVKEKKNGIFRTW